MEAKKFLNQLKKLDKLIENKLIEKNQWKTISTGTTANMCGERVQTSGSKSKMADAVVKYVDLEREINERIDALVDERKNVISVIEQLNTVEYDLLHKMYVQYYTLYEIASMYKKTYSWATSIHGRALKNVQKILDERQLTE